MSRQSCAVCAWRENCAKRFCIPDGGARCPDFSRDISIKNAEESTTQTEKDTQNHDEKPTDPAA